MKKFETHAKPVSVALISIALTTCLTGCGGGPLEDEASLGAQPARKVTYSAQRGVVPVEDNFGNFNPSIWNERNWYDCDCGRHQAPSAPTPWKQGN
ncbi:hypothetical protein [Noviherbaspirillum humi]|uniref:hypothetical protein n=1 Tax=Noviherbaspirillum humi TaxID=1688639 RepID=UPI000B798151|nr:hypothetical protein [Noviherbaspirillum humi]